VTPCVRGPHYAGFKIYNNLPIQIKLLSSNFNQVKKVFRITFMFIPCILNNKSLLCTNICTNNGCKFVLKLLRYVSVMGWELVLRPSYSTHTHTTGSKLRCQTTTKHTTNISEPLWISVKYSSILPDDGSHTIRNMSEWSLILWLLKFLYNVDFNF